MSFLEEVDDLQRKVPRGKLPAPVLAGIAGVVALALVGVGVMQAGSPGLVLEAAPVETAAPAAVSEGGDESAAGMGSAGSQGGAATSAGQGNADGASAALAPVAPSSCYVYVVGAVEHPGVYRVSAASRVNDAVAAAGGFAADAAPEAVNLARTVEDGEQITIPTRQQVEEGFSVPEAPGLSPGPTAGGTSEQAVTAEGKVNLNTASAQELQTLDGIGEATAGKIIASREQEGPFQSPEDLKRVSGIGEKKYAAIASQITV